MSTRYGERGFGRYEEPDDDRTEDRDYERDDARGYGEAGRGLGRGSDYGLSRRGGYTPTRGGGYGREYGYERDYGSREYYAGEYEQRPGPRDYGSRYGRETYGGHEGYGGYAGQPRRYEGGDYGRAYTPRSYGRDAGRAYARGAEDEGVREYDTDYGRTTSRFYGRSGYEYGRDDYEDERDRRAYGRAMRDRGDEREGGSWLDRAADQVRSWFGGDDDDDDDRRERGPRGDEARRAYGRGEGKFRGRGPKNYRRSDDRVREEVCDRLTESEWLDASDVEVNVVAGEVILTGTVDSRYAKRLAENIAESVTGVANVQNNLRVHRYQADETRTAVALPAGSDTTAAPGTTPAAPESDLGDSNTTPDVPPSSKAAGRS